MAATMASMEYLDSIYTLAKQCNAMHSEEIGVMNLWGVCWRKFFLPGWLCVRVQWLGCCCRAEAKGMCWSLGHSYVNILCRHAANVCRYLCSPYHLQQFLFHSLTSYPTGCKWWYVFVYDGIGGIFLCINLMHSAACVALHEGRQISCPDVSDRVQRCSTFRETMAVHTLQCAHRHLESNNELPETGMFLLHPYSSSFGFHAPSTHSFNWVLNVLKNATGGTWLVKARFLFAIHINFKINTICKYACALSAACSLELRWLHASPRWCTQIYWTWSPWWLCHPFGSYTKKLPDSREAFGKPSSLLQNIQILPQKSVCLFDAFVPSIQGIFKHEFLHNNCEVKESISNHSLLIQAVVPSLDCVIFLEKLFSHSQNPYLGVCDF